MGVSILLVSGFCFPASVLEKFIPRDIEVSVLNYHPDDLALIPQICGPKTILVGWSLGGKIVLKLMREGKIQSCGIYLVNQSPDWSPVIAEQRQFLEMVGVKRYLEEFYQRSFKGWKGRTALPAELVDFMQRASEKEISRLLSELESFSLIDYTQVLHQVQFIHTRYDAIASPGNMTRFCQDHDLPLKIIKGAMSHFPFYSESLWKEIRK